MSRFWRHMPCWVARLVGRCYGYDGRIHPTYGETDQYRALYGFRVRHDVPYDIDPRFMARPNYWRRRSA